MQKFYFNELGKFSVLVGDLNLALAKFNNRDIDVPLFIQSMLEKTIGVFKELGDGIKESEVGVMLSEFLLTRKGLNTIKYEKQNGGRTELKHLITYKILQQLQVLLQSVIDVNNVKITEATSLISQIVTAAIQSNILNDDGIENYKPGTDAESVWQLLASDSTLLFAQKRSLLIVSKYDCLIILDDLITRLK